MGIEVVTVTLPMLPERTHTTSTKSTKSQLPSPTMFVAQKKVHILLLMDNLILSVVWTVPTTMDIVDGITIRPMITQPQPKTRTYHSTLRHLMAVPHLLVSVLPAQLLDLMASGTNVVKHITLKAC